MEDSGLIDSTLVGWIRNEHGLFRMLQNESAQNYGLGEEERAEFGRFSSPFGFPVLRRLTDYISKFKSCESQDGRCSWDSGRLSGRRPSEDRSERLT